MPPGVLGGSSATSSRLYPQRPLIGQYCPHLPLLHFLFRFAPFFGIWVRMWPLSLRRPPESSLPHGWLKAYVSPLLVSPEPARRGTNCEAGASCEHLPFSLVPATKRSPEELYNLTHYRALVGPWCAPPPPIALSTS